MKKIAILALALSSIAAISCSKSGNNNRYPIDPAESTFTGHWRVQTSEGTALEHVLGGDSLIFSADGKYASYYSGQSSDAGSYSLGHGEALNGFGRMQAYDSIVFKTNLMTEVYRPVLFFRFTGADTLSFSTAYYKDSAQPKGIARYIKVK